MISNLEFIENAAAFSLRVEAASEFNSLNRSRGCGVEVSFSEIFRLKKRIVASEVQGNISHENCLKKAPGPAPERTMRD